MRVAIVVVLAAAIVALFYLTGDDSTGGGRARRAAEEAAEREKAREAGAGAEAEEGKRKRDVLMLAGTVVTEDERPVPDAEVRLRVWDDDDNGWKDRSDRMRVGADGRFEMEVERTRHMLLRATHPRYQAADLYVDPSLQGEALKLVMLRGAPLTVVVRNPDASPTAGILVTGYTFRRVPGESWYYHVELDATTTDAAGVAAMGAVPEGELDLKVEEAGFAPVNVKRSVSGLDPVRIEVVLDRGGAAEGRVTSPDGKPVAGARVHVQGKQLNVATTDEHGAYRLEGLPAWGVRIVAEADGFGPGYFGDGLGWGRPVPIKVPSGETERGVDVVLSLPSWVTGRIVDGQDAPVAGARVWAYVHPGFAEERDTRTDADGRFRCGPYSLKGEASVSLNFRAKTHTLGRVKERKILPGRDLDVGTLKAVRRATVRGIVFDVDGSPLRKGHVSGKGASTGVRPDGTFELTGIAAGKSQLVAWSAGKERKRSRPYDLEIEAGGTVENAELRLIEPLTIEGRVLTQDGRPRADVDMMITVEGKQPPFDWGRDVLQESETEPDGSFKFVALVPGRYTIGVGEWGDKGLQFKAKPKPVTVEAGAADIVYRWPQEGGTILGRVVDRQTGLPIPKFEVTAFRIVMFLPRYSGRREVDDAQGNFRLENEEAGFFAIEVEAKGYAPFRTKPKAVKKGAKVDFGTIKLGYAGAVKGTVRDHAGRAVRWAKIHLLSPKLETNLGAPMTDKRGKYEVEGLAPGKYTLFAVSPRHPLALVRNIEIEEGRKTEVDVAFSPSAPCTLKIVDEQSQPIEGARLIWTFDAIKPIDSSMVGSREPPGYGSNVSDREGVIEKPYFPAGAVDLRIEAKGFETARRSVELKPGEPKTVEIRLARE